MQNKIQQIIDKIKKSNKKRTISLAIFLSILIVMPLVLKSPQEKQNIKQHAQTVPQETIAPIQNLPLNVTQSVTLVPTGATQNITPQISLVPTLEQIEDPYSPQINPWIFIIPAIIIGLAIIFQ